MHVTLVHGKVINPLAQKMVQFTRVTGSDITDAVKMTTTTPEQAARLSRICTKPDLMHGWLKFRSYLSKVLLL